jgi:hypothetical protein
MRKEYNFSQGRRGAVIAAAKGKSRITIRLDDDILEWFRQQVDDAGGGSYQTMINGALRAYMESRPESLEAIVRRVVMEQLRKTSPRQRKARKAA